MPQLQFLVACLISVSILIFEINHQNNSRLRNLCLVLSFLHDIHNRKQAEPELLRGKKPTICHSRIQSHLSSNMSRIIVLPLIIGLVHVVLGAVPHSHSHGAGERMQDGAYSPRDHGHYKDGAHDAAFDHEAILG